MTPSRFTRRRPLCFTIVQRLIKASRSFGAAATLSLTGTKAGRRDRYPSQTLLQQSCRTGRKERPLSLQYLWP